MKEEQSTLNIVKILKLDIFPTVWNIKIQDIILFWFRQLKVTFNMKNCIKFLKYIYIKEHF